MADVGQLGDASTNSPITPYLETSTKSMQTSTMNWTEQLKQILTNPLCIQGLYLGRIQPNKIGLSKGKVYTSETMFYQCLNLIRQTS